MASFTWESDTDGRWDVAGNWVSGAVPNGSSADVTINSGAPDIAAGTQFVVDSVTLTSSAAVLDIQGELEISGAVDRIETATGSRPGTINIGDNAILDAENTATLDNAVINLGATAGGASIYHDLQGEGGALVLGPGVTLNAIGTNDRLVEDGGGTILNQGSIEVGAGDQLAISGGGTFANAGVMDIAAGGAVSESLAFANTGSINVAGVLNLNGAVSGAALSHISLSPGGVVNLIGVADLGGSSFTLPQTGTFNAANGTIQDGTIVTDGVALAGNLGNDVIIGPLDIAAATRLIFRNTITVETATGSRPGTINIGDNAILDAENTATLDNAVINLGATAGGASIYHDLQGEGGALVLGPGVTLNAIGTNDRLVEDGGGTILNQGSIEVGAGDQLAISGSGTFANAGVMDIAAGGAVSESLAFANTGSINVAGVLNLNGAVSGAALSHISLSPGGVVNLIGVADLGGSSFTLPQTGTFNAANGTIQDGTIVTDGVALAGNLGNDVIIGPLDIAAATRLIFRNTITVETATGSRPGTINIGDNAILDAENTATLDNAVINLGATAGGASIYHDLQGEGGALVLGPGVTLNAIGTNDRLVEDGGGTILNQGSIEVGAGDQLAISGGGTFANAGVMDIAAGGAVSESLAFANTGSINVAGVLNLNGAVSGAALSHISLSPGGVVNLIGVADLGGSSFTLPQTGTFNAANGTIQDGTIVTDGVALAGNLGNDVIIGPLDIAAATRLIFRNTITVETATGSRPGTINIGDNAILDAENTATLDNAVINLGATAGGASIYHDLQGEGGALVLGPGVTLNAIGTNDRLVEDGGGTILNQGSIEVGAGDQLAISGGGTFANAGVMDIAAGGAVSESLAFANTGSINVAGVLNLNGAVSGAALSHISLSPGGVVNLIGVADLGGSSFTLPQTGTFNAANGTIQDGTIVTDGVALAGNLGNDVIIGPLDIAAATRLIFRNTITVETATGSRPGTINIGDNAILDAENTATLDNAVINLGATAGGASIYHDLQGEGGALVLGPGVTLNAIGTNDLYEDGGGTILNQGSIEIGAGDQLVILGGGSFANEGLIQAVGRGTGALAISETLLTEPGMLGTFGAAAGSTLAIDLGGSKLTTDSGRLVLDGAGSEITEYINGVGYESLESVLTTIGTGGLLEVLSGRNYTAAGPLVVAGTVDLRGGVFTSPTITLAGAGAEIIGNGTLDGAIINNGLIDADPGTLVINSFVSGSGILDIDPSSELVLVAGGSENVDFLGTSLTPSTLKLDTPAHFSGTLIGLGLLDVIDIASAKVKSAVISGHEIDILFAGGGTLTYDYAGSLAGEHFGISSDGTIGSNLTLLSATMKGGGGGGGGSGSSPSASHPGTSDSSTTPAGTSQSSTTDSGTSHGSTSHASTHASTSHGSTHAATSPSSTHAATSPSSTHAATSPSSTHHATSPSSSHHATSPSGTHAATSPSGTHAATSPSGTHAATSPSGTHAATSPSGTHAATSPSGTLMGTCPSSTSPSGTLPPTQPSTSPSGTSGGGAGDTHLVTFDGLHYDLQASGEFTLVKNDDIDVQIRLEPSGGAQHPSGAVSFIDQTAFMLGGDRITIDNSRTDPLWLNGAPVTLLPGQFLPLAGGTIYNKNGVFLAVAKTGEDIRVTGNNTSVFLGSHTQDVTGLLGNADGNSANDLQLPDGTTLSQPLSFDTLYDTFASAWRVTTLTSLFDYGPGESTQTYTNLDFPPAPVSLSDLPQSVVDQAEQAVAALGITNPIDQQNAVLDYILAGGGAAQEDADSTRNDTSTSNIQITPAPPTPYLGVTGETGVTTISGTGDQATFTVFLTTPVTKAVDITYQAVDGYGGVSPAEYGGMLPGGTIEIAAGATVATIVLALPGSLALPDEVLDLRISTSTQGVALANADGYVSLHSGLPVAGLAAVPVIYETGDTAFSRLNMSGSSYVLDFGTIGANGVDPAEIILDNAAFGIGDTLGGKFVRISGDGFTLAALGSNQTVVPGAADELALTIGTSLGAHDEFFTITPYSTNATGFESLLPAITLEVKDTVVLPTAVPGTLAQQINLIARIGEDFGNSITISNSAPPGGDKLGVTLSETGGHVLPVQNNAIAPGGSAVLSLNNNNTTSGTFTDTLSVGFRDVPPHGSITSLGTSFVTLDGTVFQEASVSLSGTVLNFGTLHQGAASPTLSIDVSNLVAPGAYSDTLIARYGAEELTLAPGATGALDFTLNTGAGGRTTQDALVTFISRDPDLPDLLLITETVTLQGELVSNALPAFTASGGTLADVSATQAVLNLGSFQPTGTAYDFSVGISNTAASPGDPLSGTLSELVNGSLVSLGTISHLAAGSSSPFITLSFTPQMRGAFTETITFTGSDDVTGALSTETLTVEADVACFVAGTRIRTDDGEQPVESLVIGQSIPTLHAGSRRIKWLGTRSYAAPFLTRNHLALPVCVAAGALAPGVPARDLWLSPGHALCLDGVLVHAWRLINGVSIHQPTDTRQVTYYHVELESHEILFAEQTPVESFMGEAFRQQFQNAASFHEMYPEPAVEQRMCLPRLDDGFALEAMRRRLAARAGLAWPAPAMPARPRAKRQYSGALRGYVDQVGPDFVTGWAQYEAAPETPVALDILGDGHRLGRVLANLYRADLRQAGLGSGNHGFAFRLPAAAAGLVAAGLVEVRSSDRQLPLPRAADPAREDGQDRHATMGINLPRRSAKRR